MNEDLMVVNESFDEDEMQIDANSALKSSGGASELHNISNLDKINLASKYSQHYVMEEKHNKPMINELFLNNGNKDMIGDMSTKIAPESDRQPEDKKLKKKKQSIKVKPQGEEALLLSDGKKKKKKANKKRLIMNVSQTKYYVVRYVAKNIYKMKLTHNDDEDWDIRWQDGAVQCE